jgi:putative endonuclease
MRLLRQPCIKIWDREVPTLKSVRGRKAETYACAYLRRKGCELLARNYSYAGGELDIVARDRSGKWLFVEVKSVWEDSFGAPDNRVNDEKQRKIWQTALHFLYNNGNMEQNSRFDVVAMDFRGKTPILRYYENAFVASSVIPDLRIRKKKRAH